MREQPDDYTRLMRDHPLDYIRGDVCDDDVIASALKDVRDIVHLAAVVGYPACAANPDLAARTNVAGTKALIRIRHPSQKILFASTSSVYGRGGDSCCAEDAHPLPKSLYAVTKLEAESLLLREPNTAALRFATGFGVSPSMRFDLLVNQLVADAVHHGRILIYEAGFRRSFVHIKDMARGFALALTRWSDFEGRVFNVGDSRMNMTKGELGLAIAEIFPCSVEFDEFGSDVDQRDFSLSFDKMRARGFRAQVSIAAELQAIGSAASRDCRG